MDHKKSAKVVIADDDGITRHLLRTLLREHGFDVVGEATNGGDALELCATLNPDVLCLDINMPKMGGFEALHAIKQRSPHLAVVMISSSATLKNVEEARSHGADGFIVKPFRAASVIDTLRKYLR
jgi:two-component system chemotaxis response regulator CheY